MARKRQSPSGMSLVELIIVMGIVATFAAIAIPSLYRMGVFSHTDQRDTARSLVTLMKAARMYAATFRVDTAVVYTLGQKEDSETGAQVAVIDGMGLFRGLSQKDERLLESRLRAPYVALGQPIPAALQVFLDNLSTSLLPILSDEGGFHPLPQGACLPDPREGTTDLALTAVQLYDDQDGDGDYFTPVAAGAPESISPRPEVDNDGVPTGRMLGYLDPVATPLGFPAHIFRPSGEVDAPYGTVPRVHLEVIPAPDAASVERYEEYQNQANNKPVPPIVVDLYTTMGRAEISS